MGKEFVDWQCKDFTNAPFYKPNFIACTYTKPYNPQTIVLLDKQSGDVKVWNPQRCESQKGGYVVCKGV